MEPKAKKLGFVIRIGGEKKKTNMSIEITAMLHVDVRNPHDKLVFKIFGIMMPHDPIINYVNPMTSNAVVQYFETFAKRGQLGLALTVTEPSDATAVWRLFSISGAGQNIREVKLSGKETRAWSGHPFATLKLSEVKIDRVVPVTSEANDERRFLVNLSSESSAGIVMYGQ